MSQNFAANAIRQMPQVASRYLLDMKIIGKLVANRLDQTTYAFAKPQLLWIKLSSPPILGRHRKLKSLRLKKFRFQWLRKICPVTQKQAGVTIVQFPNHVNVMDVRGGNGKTKMTAIIACMRKLMTILNTMIARNEGWNPKLA